MDDKTSEEDTASTKTIFTKSNTVLKRPKVFKVQNNALWLKATPQLFIMKSRYYHSGNFNDN